MKTRAASLCTHIWKQRIQLKSYMGTLERKVQLLTTMQPYFWVQIWALQCSVNYGDGKEKTVWTGENLNKPFVPGETGRELGKA